MVRTLVHVLLYSYPKLMIHPPLPLSALEHVPLCVFMHVCICSELLLVEVCDLLQYGGVHISSGFSSDGELTSDITELWRQEIENN